MYPLHRVNSINSESNIQPPPDAFEAIPDGGYGWTVVFANAVFLFWTNGFTVTWAWAGAASGTLAVMVAAVSAVTASGGR